MKSFVDTCVPSIMNTTNTSLCRSSCPLARGEVLQCGDVCMAKVRLEDTLQKFLKIPRFQPGQLEALLPLAHGKDVFLRMATGGGKSICMFVFPLATSATAIASIINPLNCLMNQQVCIVYSEICIHQLDDKCVM